MTSYQLRYVPEWGTINIEDVDGTEIDARKKAISIIKNDRPKSIGRIHDGVPEYARAYREVEIYKGIRINGARRYIKIGVVYYSPIPEVFYYRTLGPNAIIRYLRKNGTVGNKTEFARKPRFKTNTAGLPGLK